MLHGSSWGSQDGNGAVRFDLWLVIAWTHTGEDSTGTYTSFSGDESNKESKDSPEKDASHGTAGIQTSSQVARP